MWADAIAFILCMLAFVAMTVATGAALVTLAEWCAHALYQAAVKPCCDLILIKTRYYQYRCEVFEALREVIIHNEFSDEAGADLEEKRCECENVEYLIHGHCRSRNQRCCCSARAGKLLLLTQEEQKW
jgi:hypothetical protein